MISGARFGGLDHGSESLRIAYGHVGQELTIDPNIGLSHGVDETAVSGPIQTCRRIDTSNPQTAQIAFPVASITIRIPQGFGARLFCAPE